MAVKIALAVGLFIVICVIPGLKSSQLIPDGLVFTEVKKTLVRGVQGVLTCRFYGDPIAVYWRKGFDPDDLSLMVIWHEGEVSGPRYDDGSCDVDENYSLIINNVSTADAGRIYCTVSNNKGPLMKNYTDILVLDNAITTNQQVTLQMRRATYGILQCTVHIKARRVSWKKGTTSSANESLVVMESNENVTERSGAGYFDGTYNITQDYSLIIKVVQVHHEGLYVCEVTDDTGISFQNHTFVNVVAQPLEPFPTVQECLNAKQHDSNYCILVAKSGMTLTCQATKYYPSINLVFLYGSIVAEHSNKEEWENKDGTKNKTITIATRGNKELYTCVASSIPGTNANTSTSVLLQGDEPVKSTMVIILVLFAALILISSVAYFIWKKKHHVSNSPDLPVKYSPIPASASHQDLEDIGEVKDLTQEDLQALEQRVNDASIRHYIMLHDFLETKSTIQDDDIISENRTALFNTHQMLIDWRESRKYTRVKETTEKENEPDHTWPSNEELKTISRHLTQEAITKICEKQNIDCQNDEANDERKRLKNLRKWRAKASDEIVDEQWEQIFSVLVSNNLGGLLPTFNYQHEQPTLSIPKAELVDMAFHLVIHDLFPIAKELGINATKLASYRPAFHSSHLKLGTIRLLSEVGEDCMTSEITNLHYRTVTARVLFEYDMSYGELCSISEAINRNVDGCADQATSGMLPEELGNLQDVLQLTDQDIADRFDNSHPITAYELFKIWKEMPRPSVFNYRAALADELRGNGKLGLADEIIAGTYITEHTSLAFIENMIQVLSEDQIRSLGEILQLSGDKEHWHTTTPSNEISEQIYDWVADWTTAIKVPPMKATAEKHRDLNNKLVENGSLDLAREIMIIERQLGCTYWMYNYHDENDINNSNDRSSSSDSSNISSISSFH